MKKISHIKPRHFGIPNLALIFILATSAAIAAATTAPQTYVAVEAPHPMVLDPTLRDAAWILGTVNGPKFENLTTREPAAFPTSVYLLYDSENLYIGFRAQQTGAPITATQTTNAVGFGLDDFVGVAIDTTGAGSDVYFFETTPKGVRYQQASENVLYAPRWQSAARVEGSSWTAEMIIPLKVLRIRPGAQNSWRLNFIRSVAAQNEHYTWCFNSLMVDGQVGQTWPTFTDARYWPTFALSGINTVVARPKPSTALYGLESAGSQRDEFEQANGTFLPESVRSVGVDATIPVTATINLVGTLDPDFSNVEIDQQTIVPQEFRRGLQEYRPFFAQGASFFNPGTIIELSSPTSPVNQEFYSPDIGPFDRGVSLEGTFGMQAFGLLSFRGFDETTGNTFDDTAYGYQHATKDQSFQYWLKGVLAHHSLAGDDITSDFGGSDEDYKSGWIVSVDHAIEHGSWVPDTQVADSTVALVGRQRPNYLTYLAYADISPNYNPIDGFTFNSDIHGFQAALNATGVPTWAKNYALLAVADRFFDDSGAVHEADAYAQLSASFKNGFSIDGLGPIDGVLRSYDIPENSVDCSGPSIGSSFFTGFPCYLDGQTQRFNLFQTAFGYRDGTPAPIDASTSWGPFGANYTHLYSIKTSRPLGQRFSLGLEYDGTDERSFATGELDSQWLRRVSLGESLGPDSNVSLSVRSINGLGGFSPNVGTDVALAYHRRFANGNELFVNYGTPAAYATVHRFIVKYVLHTGGAAGT